MQPLRSMPPASVAEYISLAWRCSQALCFVSVLHRRSRPTRDETVAPISRSAVARASTPSLFSTDQDGFFLGQEFSRSDRANQLSWASASAIPAARGIACHARFHPSTAEVSRLLLWFERSIQLSRLFFRSRRCSALRSRAICVAPG
jgi:hypothetical protein